MIWNHGELDFIPEQGVEAAGASFTEPTQNVVVYPGAPHATITQTEITGGGHCSLDVVTAFFQDPTAAPATQCLNELEAVDFTVDTMVSTTFLGTPDAYEGDPGPNVAPPSMSQLLPADAELVRRVRRGIVK